MLVWLCVPFFHLQLARQLNLAASGALLSASRAPSSASTLTPFWTCFSACVLMVASSGDGTECPARGGQDSYDAGDRGVAAALDWCVHCFPHGIRPPACSRS